ncbi:MAG: hypothetical protein P1V13_14065 [Rhizobiaceae bacterium]|nr:hypothetical protein [Rhizobiaceae bacterium]
MSPCHSCKNDVANGFGANRCYGHDTGEQADDEMFHGNILQRRGWLVSAEIKHFAPPTAVIKSEKRLQALGYRWINGKSLNLLRRHWQ